MRFLCSEIAAGRAQLELLRSLILQNANYSARVRPVAYASDAVNVTVHFNLYQLLAIVRTDILLNCSAILNLQLIQ